MKFKWLLQFTCFQRSLSQFFVTELSWVHSIHLVVDHMVQTCGQQSLEVTKEVFMDMNRADLVQRLSETSSQLKEKLQAKPLQKEATMTSLQEKLFETLEDLLSWEFEQFKDNLQYTNMEKGLPTIPASQMELAGRAEIVMLMEKIYGEESVEVTREVLKRMNRRDLVQRLSDISSGSIKKHSVDEHQGASSETEATMTSLQKKLLQTLEDFSDGDLEKFKHVLQYTKIKEGLPRIPGHRMELAGRAEIVTLMEEIYGQESVEVTREVLKRMNRRDLVQKLSDISSGSKGPPKSLELEGCGSIKDSSDWTKLEPEVSSTDADEAPTYSLQSERGSFECSVSGLRWASKEKVSFKYQFCSWEEPMERMKNIQYMPAGPLMDITITAGKFEEVYLPHWICIDDNTPISDKFAVLHIDDCGDVVEKVSEVTPSHVKLSKPIFSPRAVLMKVGFPVKINCNVLIYKTNTAFLTLHVYLIPRDPALQQTLDKRESSYGYKVIRKPPPEKSLKMRERFVLTADLDGAEIYPEKLKLRYESTLSLFFEVYFEKPDTNFKLKLTQENELQPVWTCAIRKDEYQRTDHIQVEHFVDKNQCDLIERVSNIGPILDNLLRDGVIQQEGYDTICVIPTTQEKMRKLYSGPLKAGGLAAKDIFYKILEKEESYLVADLKKKES
ncbi:NACHT, LRR and PYD domains-containing protein 1 homolog isoform 2-T2 [Symphorus nematophorus]